MRRCTVDGCGLPLYAVGLCVNHYAGKLRNGTPEKKYASNKGLKCSVDGCDEPARCKVYCSKHYLAFRHYGDPLVSKSKKGKASNVCSTTGYRKFAFLGRRKGEHVWVMERAIGRELIKGEQVHHKDGNKLNNDISNLVLCSSVKEHISLHIANGTWTGGRPMRIYTIGGISKGLREWSSESGICYQTLHGRLKRGISIEEAILK